MSTIKDLRVKQELSQKQLSVLMGVAQPTVCAWENGTKFPSGEKLKRLAQLLGTTVDYLLDESNDPEPLSPGLVIPDELKDVRVAFHRGEFEDLTQDEVDALALIAKTLKAQRK